MDQEAGGPGRLATSTASSSEMPVSHDNLLSPIDVPHRETKTMKIKDIAENQGRSGIPARCLVPSSTSCFTYYDLGELL